MDSITHIVKLSLKRLINSQSPFQRKFFEVLFKTLKYIRYLLLRPQYLYESYIAAFIGKYLFFIYWPLFKLFDAFDICFVVNVAPAVGHTIPELDNFFRKIYLKEIDTTRKYCFVVKGEPIFRDFIKLYRKKFHFAVANSLLYDLLLPLFMRYKEITLDSGISRLKWQFFDSNDKRGVQIKGMPFLFQFSPYEGNAQVHDAYARRLKCERYFPLAIPKEQCVPLLEKLGIAGRKLALIHIKNYVMNSAAALTDPNTYLPSMGMLKDLGYKLVFVGREKMPEQFHQFDILNYAESFLASLKHDVFLFQSCELAMVTSGISNLAECYDKAFLYINSWHAGLCPFSKWSLFLPALVKRKTGEWLKFSAQNDLYHEVTTMHERFPYDGYIPRNANGDEILHAAQELLALMKEYKPRSFLQERYMSIDKGRGVLANSLTRVGQYFLEEHQNLLDG